MKCWGSGGIASCILDLVTRWMVSFTPRPLYPQGKSFQVGRRLTPCCSPYWEANSRSTSQNIPRLLWNPKVHYRVHSSLQLVPILIQRQQVHTFPPCTPKTQMFAFLISAMRATSLSLLIILDLITQIIFGEAYKLRSSSLCNLFQPPTTSFSVQILSAPCSQTNLKYTRKIMQ